MKISPRIIGGLVLLLVLLAGVYWYALNREDEVVPETITSFEECTEAGYPVVASNPRECETPDGEKFIQQRTISLYYYNPDKDTDAEGNIMCSPEGLAAVERTIPLTTTPVQDAVELLIGGELTPKERERGITTEFPLDDFSLEGASLKDGVLTFRFADPQFATSGGSCRAGILWFQIRETAKQFDGVEEIRFEPEELFQP